MKTKDINTLKRLLQENDVKGKKLLERVIWLNESKPKYEVGKIVRFTNRGYTINGTRLIDWIGTVEKIDAISKSRTYWYHLKVKYKDKFGNIQETSNYVDEINIKPYKGKNEVNCPSNAREGEEQAISLSFFR